MAFFKSNTPHFFKIVLDQTLYEGKLEVPKTFVESNGNTLLNNKVWLKLENGAFWKVGLEKINGKIMLKYGWREFMEFYSIQYAHLIVFRYEGDSCFHVLIFDKTGSEIQYPFKGNTVIEDSDDDDLQILEDISSKRVVQQPSHVLPPIGSKRKKMEKNKEKVVIEYKSREIVNLEVVRSRKQPLSSSSSREGLRKKALHFQSMISNPSFVLEIRPSYTYPKTKHLNIPRSFAHMHLKENVDIVLRVSDVGRAWNVRYAMYETTNGINGEMTTGWKEFARDNNLKDGNICVFEMIGSKNVSMKVTIFRG